MANDIMRGMVAGGDIVSETAVVGYKPSGVQAPTALQNSDYLWVAYKNIRHVIGVWLQTDPGKVGTNYAALKPKEHDNRFDGTDIIDGRMAHLGYFQLTTTLADATPVIVDYAYSPYPRPVIVDGDGVLESNVTVTITPEEVAEGVVDQASFPAAVANFQLATPYAPPLGIISLNPVTTTEMEISQIYYYITGGAGNTIQVAFYQANTGNPNEILHIIDMNGADGVNADGFNVVTLTQTIKARLGTAGTLYFKFVQVAGALAVGSFIGVKGLSK